MRTIALQLLIAFALVAISSSHSVRGLAADAQQHNADAVQHDLGDSHIVWDTSGARGDSHSWAQAHQKAEHAAKAVQKAEEEGIAAAKKNAVHNSDGHAKKTAAAHTTTEDVAEEPNSSLNVKVLALYGMAAAACVVMLMATMNMVKRRTIESVEIPAIPP